MPAFFRVRALAPALLLGPALAAWSLPAAACSTCKCADYTITLLGLEKPYEDRLRLGLDTVVRSETHGAGGDRSTMNEVRTLFGAAYSFGPDFTLALQMPYVHKSFHEAGESAQSGAGWGDADLVGRYVLLREGGVSGRHLFGLRAGLRLPTAQTLGNARGRFDIDAQPDAGAWAPTVGPWYSYFRFPWFLTVSATYTSFGAGHQDFEAGDSYLLSSLAQYAFTPALALQAGLDARHSNRNREEDGIDPDSGGTLLMGGAGLAWRPAPDLVFHLNGQAPLAADFHGRQTERPSVVFGVAYDF